MQMCTEYEVKWRFTAEHVRIVIKPAGTLEERVTDTVSLVQNEVRKKQLTSGKQSNPEDS